MNKKSPILARLAILGACLAIPSMSFANQDAAAEASPAAASNASAPDIHNGFNGQGGLTKRVLLDDGSLASSASSYYFKLGVQRYKNEQWDEAEAAFEKVILTNNLRKQAYFYLAHINSKQGEDAQVIKYVKAYHGFGETYVTEDCLALVASSDLGLVQLMESVNAGLVPEIELTSRIIELTESLDPDVAKACQPVSKGQAGHVQFLESE